MNIMDISGVWADNTAQVIITNNIMLLFEKVKDEVTVYACNHSITNGKLSIEVKAGINFNETRQTSNCLIKSFDDKNIVQWGDINNKIKKPQTFKIDTDSKNNSTPDNTIGLYLNEDTCLEYISFNNQKHILKLVEKIEVVDFDEQPKAHKENIGYCIENWNKLGLIEQHCEEKEMFSCRVILKHHDFHLNIMEDEMIYCNSNLLASNNNGRVWDQKIRLMNHKESNQFSILFPENCLDVLSTKLAIDDQLFTKDSCNFLPGMLRYWSLDSFSDDQIIINGCGEKYNIDRITEDPSDQVSIEFFK